MHLLILEKQKMIRILFIVLNILAWYADNNLEKNLIENKKNNISKNIYIFFIIVSIIVNYFYITINKGPNKDKINLRTTALTLIITALFIFLYLQITDENDNVVSKFSGNVAKSVLESNIDEAIG